MADNLTNLRKRLKSWESEFAAQHGHKPGKDDIDAGPPEIKELYINYSKLKKQMTENVWGPELNKKKDVSLPAEKEPAPVDKIKPSQPSFMKKLGQKLMNNAASISNLKAHSKPDRMSAVLRPNLVENEKSEDIPHKERDQSHESVQLKPINTIFLEGLKLVKKSEKKAFDMKKKTSEDDDIPLSQFSMFKNMKRSSFMSRSIADLKMPGVDDEVKTPAEQTLVTSPAEDFTKSFIPFGGEDSNSYINPSQNPSSRRKVRPSGETKALPPKENVSSFEFMNVNEDANDCQRFNQLKKTDNLSATYEEKPTGQLPVSNQFNASKDNLETIPSNQTAGSTRKSNKSGDVVRSVGVRKKRKRPLSHDSDEEKSSQSSCIIDVSWKPEEKPETLMIDLDPEPRSSDPDKSLSLDSPIPQEKKRKFAANRGGPEKALNNDNFVRLNMKVKTYKRKGRQMTGGKWKRLQWKQKMAARANSDSGACFKCGETGHWANKCKGKAKKSSTNIGGGKAKRAVGGDSAAEELKDSDFPTMRQAMSMARGIKHADELTAGNNEDDDDIELPDVIRTTYDPPPPPPPTDPIYSLNDDGSVPEPTEEVMQALGLWGYDSFRPGQQRAVMRVLCGQSTLVVLSTGAGKSLCYQLPAYLYAQKCNAITLVISPLVSLMEDQITGLPSKVKGACLHYNMTEVQRSKVLESVTAGNVHFLLVSPETLVSGGGAGGLLSKLPSIAFACIDEAHCVSEWSHHFRPSYLRICKVLQERFGVRCLLGLTATATMVTAASVSQHLGISNYAEATIRGLPVPPNLQLSVSCDQDKDMALVSLLSGERFARCHSIIVYCTRREQTDRIATVIRTCMKDVPIHPDVLALHEQSSVKAKKAKGPKLKAPLGSWHAECYHAGLSSAARKRIQNAFMSGRLRVVVATVAFGMGLDKSDVRGIIHYNLPRSFESYVQEIGRAGRDGNTAHCHVFLDPQGRDMMELKKHIFANTVDRIVIKRLCQRVFPSCRCREMHKRKRKQHKDVEFEDDGVDYSQIDTTQSELPSQLSQSEVGLDFTPDEQSKAVQSRCLGGGTRICPGHERAVPIATSVTALDMKEEGISTLLCYLELHQKRYVENLTSVYATCSIQCYGGPSQMNAIAKKCPPVAVACARERRQGKLHGGQNSLVFPVVEISDAMGWDSAPVKRELKLLQWSLNNDGHSSKSGVMVEFSDLAFHLRSPGDLTDDELDDVVDFLHERVVTQERTELYQLQNFCDVLASVSHKSVYMCSEDVDTTRSDRLKAAILEYFDRQPASGLEPGDVTMLSFARETEAAAEHQLIVDKKISIENEPLVRGDVRSFIQTYGSDHQLTGRAIARVLHGIESPCFPATVWGRVRRYWRSHMTTDFNQLRRIATQELVRMK